MASTGVRHPQVTEAPNFQPTLRVMRLFSPKLETTSVLPYCPQADALCSTGTGQTSPFSQRLRPITDESSFALGNSVMLPDNFGAIFLGETFSGYISVVNHLENITLDQVVVQARLACPNSKIEESEARAPPRRPHPAVLEVALGQLNISWTTAMGERGRILSSPIVYKLPPTQDVEVQFEGLQKFVLGQASPIKCKITNRTEKPMHLQIQFRLDAMVGVYIMGKSFRNLGLVSPGQTVVSEAHLMPTVGGLHPFRGVFVVNLDTYQEYDQGIVCDIFVDSPHTSSAPPTISEVVEHELALDLQKTVL